MSIGRIFQTSKYPPLSGMKRAFGTILISNALIGTFQLSREIPSALAVAQVKFDFDDVNRLKRGLQEINFLLDNFEAKTTYCNFGEFKMELMDARNKEGLIDAARDSGLLDKTKTMNVMCKRDPEVVRAFLGLTSENKLLEKSERLMKSPKVVDLVDADYVDEYFEAVDIFTTELAAADALAYNARQDNDSQNTFKLGASTSLGTGSRYLDQSKESVTRLRDELEKIVGYLGI